MGEGDRFGHRDVRAGAAHFGAGAADDERALYDARRVEHRRRGDLCELPAVPDRCEGHLTVNGTGGATTGGAFSAGRASTTSTYFPGAIPSTGSVAVYRGA